MELIPYGLYIDLPSEKYYSDPGLSNSKLGLLKKSPSTFLYYESRSIPETPALIFGRNLHLALLEPKKFESDVIAIECSSRTTNLYKNAVEENPGKIIITSGEWEQINDIVCAINSHSLAHEYITLPGNLREASMFYERSGIRMKSRLDILNIDDGLIIDVKTTLDAEESSFDDAVARYGYYRQCAVYMAACEALGIHINKFVLIAVEKSNPIGIGVYDLEPYFLEIGRYEACELIEQYKHCKETRSWPSYNNNELRTLKVPYWLKKRFEDKLFQKEIVEKSLEV